MEDKNTFLENVQRLLTSSFLKEHRFLDNYLGSLKSNTNTLYIENPILIQFNHSMEFFIYVSENCSNKLCLGNNSIVYQIIIQKTLTLVQTT